MHEEEHEDGLPGLRIRVLEIGKGKPIEGDEPVVQPIEGEEDDKKEGHGCVDEEGV